MADYILNEHNKEEFPPAHTAEHLLNQTMIRIFGCGRSYNAHVERKKSKMSFHLDHKPSRQEEREIERRMNELIAEDLPVTFEFVTRDEIADDDTKHQGSADDASRRNKSSDDASRRNKSSDDASRRNKSSDDASRRNKPADDASKRNNLSNIDLDRLPADASETIRLVRIGDYDVCPCIGKHVRSTAQIGRFEMLGTNWDEMEHSFRVRFKVIA